MAVLQKLKLLKNGKPTRAAILLFGKDPQEFYIPAILKVGRFRPGNIIVDDREIRGTVFDQVEEVMLYFRGPAFKVAAWPISPKQVPESFSLQLVLCDDEKLAKRVCAYADDTNPEEPMPRPSKCRSTI